VVAGLEESAGTEETDPGNNLGRNTGCVSGGRVLEGKALDRNNGEKAGTDCDECVGPKTRFPPPGLSFQPNDASQDGRNGHLEYVAPAKPLGGIDPFW
jgi:hypothetical protein